MRRGAIPLLCLLGCDPPAADKATTPDTDVLLADSGESDTPVERPDTDPGVVDTDPPDTDRPDPTGAEVCFMGTGSGPVCIPVVDATQLGPDYAYPAPTDARYTRPITTFDLVALDPATRLSPNFVAGEFLQSWKGEFGFFQPHAVEHLQAIRDTLGGPLHVNSGYRNPDYNAGVGGASRSRHMYGDASDIRADTVDLVTLGARCEAEGAGYVGYYDSHVHCDWRDDPLHPVLFGAQVTMATRVLPTARTATLLPGTVWRAPAQGWDEGEPLREWTAYDAGGAVLTTGRGTSFAPPAGAARVDVWVGREVRLTHPVP